MSFPTSKRLLPAPTSELRINEGAAASWAVKWFEPAQGEFRISYRKGADHLKYRPDFVAETADTIYVLETKPHNEMTDPEVLAKRDAAVTWCDLASDHAVNNGGKHWKYVLIPHDAVAENMTLAGLASQFVVTP